MRARARIVLWAPVALLLGYEFYLSSQSQLPSLTFGVEVQHFDKLEHATYFFLIGVFFVRAARFGEGWTARRTAVVLVVLGFLYACLDELHQFSVPMRSVEVADVLADTAGVVLAVRIGEPVLRRFRLDQTIR